MIAALNVVILALTRGGYVAMVAMKERTLTHTQFAAAMTAIGWKDAELCRRLGCDGNLTTRWRRGTSPVPPDVATWVHNLAWAVLNTPPPVDWRRSGGKKG